MEKPITRALPPHTSLSPQTLYYLNSRLGSREDLAGAPDQLSNLRTSCDSLQERISQLSDQIWSQLIAHESNSVRVASLFDTVKNQLSDLRQTTSSSSSSSNEGLGQELQALAKEVARVEAVREYAETALRLATLVGDLEDSVSSAMNRTVRKHPSANSAEDVRAVALKTLKSTEDILSVVSKKHPRWSQLVSTVDHRVDRALAIIRPQAIADHRNLLASLGWPPPLSTINSPNPDAKGSSTDVKNPLLTMQRDLKQQYCESFLALCGLQELQSRRKIRQLEGHYEGVSLHQPLWAVEELVNPLSVASQRHFTKWIEKPEYIFALVYKITRDYVDSMDDLLQPLVDEAMLSGYSCREEWISAMVSSLSTYLAKEIFPTYVGQLEEEADPTIQTQARVSWLHLVDLMISFDKRIQSLASNLGTVLTLHEDGNSQKMSSLCVFCDRPDWLDLWAEIELSDLLGKLKPQIEDERNWTNQDQGASLLSGPEDKKAPLVSGITVRCLSSVIDRCRSLPSLSLRSRFVKTIGKSTVNKFMDCLLQRCQEAEGLTALTDDNALTKVARSVNGGRYFEAVLKEWCEDLFFVEMGSEISDDVNNTNPGSFESLMKTIFDDEIQRLEGFCTEWVEKLSTVILRGFDARSRDYLKNKRQWQEKGEEASALSRSFIDAMDYLQGKTSVIELGLNKMDFTRVWRNLATGIDKLIFTGLMTGNIKLYEGGVERLSNDVRVLFGVFGSWCLRPEGFFPKVSEGLKLLKMESKQLKSTLISEERWLKENGIRYLSAAEVERIVKNRVI